MSYPEEGPTLTKFNSSLLRLISINQLLDDCNEYSRMTYLKGYNVEYLKLWRNTLKAFYREIYAKTDEEEQKVIKDLFGKAKQIGKIFGKKNTPDGSIQILNAGKYNLHWKLLSEIDAKLRKLADKKGMLMTNKEQEYASMGDME